MREAVIVSTARTPIGKAFRGAFNHTQSPTLAAHVIAETIWILLPNSITLTVER